MTKEIDYTEHDKKLLNLRDNDPSKMLKQELLKRFYALHDLAIRYWRENIGLKAENFNLKNQLESMTVSRNEYREKVISDNLQEKDFLNREHFEGAKKKLEEQHVLDKEEIVENFIIDNKFSYLEGVAIEFITQHNSAGCLSIVKSYAEKIAKTVYGEEI